MLRLSSSILSLSEHHDDEMEWVTFGLPLLRPFFRWIYRPKSMTDTVHVLFGSEGSCGKYCESKTLGRVSYFEEGKRTRENQPCPCKAVKSPYRRNGLVSPQVLQLCYRNYLLEF